MQFSLILLVPQVSMALTGQNTLQCPQPTHI
jgi:hypothetical protein